MDIRSIIDPDAFETARAKPASRQTSDAKVPYSQPQSNFQSPYGAQGSAYKGPRETRPPQPPPLLPPAHPTHNDIRSPSVSSHNSGRSPYPQTPSSAISGGQYPFPQHAAQSLTHGFQPSQYGQRESHVASTPTGYQPYGQPTSISQTPTVTTPISSHPYSNQTRQSSSRSLSTSTSAQSNVVKESPKGSFDHQFDPVKAAYESRLSQQYLSQQGPPFRPPSMTERTTSMLRRDSPSASYEHQRNHSAGSYGQQQMMSTSPVTDRPGSSAVSPLAPGPRQSLSDAQNYRNKQEREKSLSVSPKTKLSGGLNPRQSNEDFTVQMKDGANVSSHMNAAKVEISEDRLAAHLIHEKPAIQSPSRSRSSLGMKAFLNSPRLNEVDSIVKESPLPKKPPTKVSDSDELRVTHTKPIANPIANPIVASSVANTIANPVRSDRLETQQWQDFAVDAKKNNTEKSPPDEKSSSQRFSPKRNSGSTQPQSQTTPTDFLNTTEQTFPDSFPPHLSLSPHSHTTTFSSVPAPVPVPITNASSSPSQSRAIPQSINEPAPTVSFPRQPSPAQTTRYSISPAVQNFTQSQVAVNSPRKEKSPQTSFSPHPSPLQTVGQSALPAVPDSSGTQTIPKSPLPEQTPSTSSSLYPAVPPSATRSPLPTIGHPSISQVTTTPPLQTQTKMSPTRVSPTVARSGTSTAVPEAMGQQTATKHALSSVAALVGSSPDRRRKRRRFEEIPIFARSCREPLGAGSRSRAPTNKARSPVRKATHPSQPNQPVTRPLKQELNGHSVLVNDVPLSNAHSIGLDSGLLGPWEDSITNTIPSDEYLRQLSDFLYKEVVGRLDVDVGPAGGGSNSGAVIEIEAKIGQLIDRNTNTRLRLPVRTECIITNDSGLRVNFKSSMTEVKISRSLINVC